MILLHSQITLPYLKRKVNRSMSPEEEGPVEHEEPLRGEGGDEENQRADVVSKEKRGRGPSFDGVSSSRNFTSSDASENEETITFKPVPIQYNATKQPKDTLQAVYKAGEYKAGLTLDLLCVQSFMAGIYIAMAGHLFLAVGGGILGSAMFPTGKFFTRYFCCGIPMIFDDSYSNPSLR
jgi:hypothetical protein